MERAIWLGEDSGVLVIVMLQTSEGQREKTECRWPQVQCCDPCTEAIKR